VPNRLGIAVLACLWLSGVWSASAQAAPANDNLAAAEALSGTRVERSGTILEATYEPGEPDHAGRRRQGSVWYRWTAPRTGRVLLHACGSLGFGAALAVYKGADQATLEAVAASDGGGCAGGGARVVFEAREGAAYSIAVDGVPGGPRPSPNFDLDLRLPANDDFFDAEMLPSAGGRSEADNLDATREANEPEHAGNPGGASLWYRWQAPSDGIYRVGTCASDFNTLLGVYTGSSVGALTAVASNDNEPKACGPGELASNLVFQATAGTTYRIAVDGYNNGASPRRGKVVLDLRRSENTVIAYYMDDSSPTSGLVRGVYLMNGSGGDKRRVFGGLTTDPALDPDARALAQAESDRRGLYGGIYWRTLDGSATRRLSNGNNDSRPDFSPDGRRIAFFSGTYDTLMTVPTLGGALVPLGAGATPSFSPDGRRIAFERGGDIMIMDADGRNVQAVTSGGESDFDPSFSPNGRWIAFARSGSPDNQIMVVRPNGDDPRPVVDQLGASDPSFSPDGTKIAFDAWDGIRSVRANGSELQLLAESDRSTGDGDGTQYARAPDWGPFDTLGPDAAITGGPSGPVASKAPSFELRSGEDGATLECRIDAAAFVPCSAAHTTARLSEGPHALSVRARDARGNLGAVATRSFTVDTVAPDTTLSGGEGEAPEREFTLASEPGAGFECKLDDAPGFSPCQSPHRVGPLPDGSHALEARAVDAAGNRDSSPARRDFVVRRPPPPPSSSSSGSGTSSPKPPPVPSPARPAPSIDRLAPRLRLPRALRWHRRTRRLRIRVSCPADELSGPCRDPGVPAAAA